MSYASLFASPPEPETILGRHRSLAPTATFKVSPLCLGAMSFGTAWEGFMGGCDKKTTFEILDYFYSKGGNFIDTANNYQDEQSESWLGEWMEKHGVRDEIVLATKYSTGFRTYTKEGIHSNRVGNNAKSMRVSVEASLKKLKTDYIDVLYIHWWDYNTSVEELMHALNQLITSGKVLYLGVSDTPAWFVSKANQYARCNGLRPFSLYQGLWSASVRDMEREIIPMCQAEGMGIAPWGSLGRGNYRAEGEGKPAEGRKMRDPSASDIAISRALESVAKRHDTVVTSIALAYVMHKAPYVFPIVGCRTVEHLKVNIAALEVKLTEEDIEEIESAQSFDFGFPVSMILGPKPKSLGPKDVFLMKTSGHFDYVDPPKSIAKQ